MNYIVKPQSPLMLGENGILPLTSYDQIIMPDGDRWDGKSAGGVAEALTSDPREDESTETPELGSMPMNALPAGGTVGQFLVKKSDASFDTEWVTIPLATGVSFG